MRLRFDYLAFPPPPPFPLSLVRAPSQVDPQSKAREVAVFCPFWLLNKTDVPLGCRDAALRSQNPQLSAPALGSLATPLLLSSARGSMHLRVGSGRWSPSINLDKIGAFSKPLIFACITFQSLSQRAPADNRYQRSSPVLVLCLTVRTVGLATLWQADINVTQSVFQVFSTTFRTPEIVLTFSTAPTVASQQQVQSEVCLTVMKLRRSVSSNPSI